MPTALMLVALLLAGCTGYARGERYLCFSPFDRDRCKNPPYHHLPVPQDSRTKDDAADLKGDR